jgi:hypothetical protein
MKIAATIIKGVCVDAGENLQEQKAAVKALVDKYGAGDDKVFVLYSSQRPAVRKRLALPKDSDPSKLYAEGVDAAKKEDAAKKKAALDAEKKAAEELKAYKAKRKANSEAVRTGRKAKADK